MVVAPTLHVAGYYTKQRTRGVLSMRCSGPSQDKVLGLEAEVAALQDRLRELELERAQHRAQLETLSQCVTSGGNNSVDPPQREDSSERAEVGTAECLSHRELPQKRGCVACDWCAERQQQGFEQSRPRHVCCGTTSPSACPQDA